MVIVVVILTIFRMKKNEKERFFSFIVFPSFFSFTDNGDVDTVVPLRAWPHLASFLQELGYQAHGRYNWLVVASSG